MGSDHSNFLSKLDYLSAGRNKTPWLQSIGLTKGTISRLINQSGDPSETILRTLYHSENASLHWLTEGKGHPFLVNRVLSDAEGAALLAELLEESGWTIYLVTGSGCVGYTLVLTQPGQYDIKGRPVDYTLVEIISGNLGAKTQEEIALEAAFENRCHQLEISQDEYQRLQSGEMGNYELIGWRNERGLLDTALPLFTSQLDKIADSPADYRSSDLTADEQRLLKRFRGLTPADQKKLLIIADTLNTEV